MFSSGFGFDEMVGSALFVSDETVTSGFASEQTKQHASGKRTQMICSKVHNDMC